ncbi:ComEA family DNA-binding protein [Rhodohalobacter sp. 8-1]|uniref:ComEA family DNA-binding protein n=1 Tax=Rhodohalobacter sp. 8-1 TaxID=3131972 RepID=UPI0030EC13D9
MKRKLFFWLDSLQISRSERIAISVLMALMLLLTSAIVFIDPAPSIDNETYADLEEVFRERSAIKQQEHAAIMARYTPAAGNTTGQEAVQMNEPVANIKSLEKPEPAQASPDTIRININKASAKELQQLPGIGPAYSERIVEWRNEHGNFSSVEQLLEIRGIGPVRLEKIRTMIVL